MKDLKSSIHGQAAKNGDPDAPKCASCHGPIHAVKASSEADSTVARKNLPDTCAKCHSDAGFLSRHKIPVAHPVASYKASVHGRAVAFGKEAATCSSCHGSHDIYPAIDPRSSVNHWKVPETCAQCHQEIAREFNESVHGEAVKAGVRDAPVCVDCHGEHLIIDPRSTGSPLNAVNVSAETCGRCHGDPRLALRNDLPVDRLPSYAEQLSRAGPQGRESDGGELRFVPWRALHSPFQRPALDRQCRQPPDNLRAMSQRRGRSQIHHRARACGDRRRPESPGGEVDSLDVLGADPGDAGLHAAAQFAGLSREAHSAPPRRESGDVVLRMNLWFRVAHWGIMASFPTLVFTGFALKYPEIWWSKPLLLWESGVGVRGGLHRTAAVVMILATLYHFVHLALKKRDRSFLWAMIPTIKDATDMLHVFRYNLGLTKQEPKFAKFNYAEKMEYWAFLWGTVVMGVSGFLLWFNNFTLRHFPKWVTDAATAVHWYEALLATFSILIWHFYLVIFDPMVYPMDTAWLNGKIPADHYRHSRPEYFRTLKRAGLVELPSDPADYEDEQGTAGTPGDHPSGKT